MDSTIGAIKYNGICADNLKVKLEVVVLIFVDSEEYAVMCMVRSLVTVSCQRIEG